MATWKTFFYFVKVYWKSILTCLAWPEQVLYSARLATATNKVTNLGTYWIQLYLNCFLEMIKNNSKIIISPHSITKRTIKGRRLKVIFSFPHLIEESIDKPNVKSRVKRNWMKKIFWTFLHFVTMKLSKSGCRRSLFPSQGFLFMFLIRFARTKLDSYV